VTLGGRLRWAIAGALAALGAGRLVRPRHAVPADRRSGLERRTEHATVSLDRRSGGDRRSGRDRRSGWDRRGSVRSSTYG
jgi:hypothetical protein